MGPFQWLQSIVIINFDAQIVWFGIFMKIKEFRYFWTIQTLRVRDELPKDNSGGMYQPLE